MSQNKKGWANGRAHTQYRGKKKIQKPKCSCGQLLTILHFLKPIGENKGPSARLQTRASEVFQASGVRKHQEICFRTPLCGGNTFRWPLEDGLTGRVEYTGYLGDSGEEVERECKVRKGTKELRWG